MPPASDRLHSLQSKLHHHNIGKMGHTGRKIEGEDIFSSWKKEMTVKGPEMPRRPEQGIN